MKRLISALTLAAVFGSAAVASAATTSMTAASQPAFPSFADASAHTNYSAAFWAVQI